MDKILVVEDSPTQAQELRLILETAGYEAAVASDGNEGLARARKGGFSLIISDILMPGLSGYELCRKVKADPKISATPFILLTTLNDPMDIISGLESGADNFITKPYAAQDLIGRVKTVIENRAMRSTASKLKVGAEIFFLGKKFTITADKEQILDLLLSTFEDIVRTNRQLETKQKELEEARAKVESYALRLKDQAEVTEEKYRLLLAQAYDAILVLDQTGRILEANRSAEQLLGTSRAELVGRRLFEFMPVGERDEREVLSQLLSKGSMLFPGVSIGGAEKGGRRADCSASAVKFGGQTFVFAILRDITDKDQLERQLRQSQKMEAVGRLAGGIAHDFNNILTAILGLSELSIKALPAADEVRKDIEEIRQASLRAARLTHQLLAFSRRQVIEPRTLDLNELIDNIDRMLRRIIGEHIELRFNRGSELPAVRIDPGQFEQLIMNLAVNARDAMPEGGALKIETSQATLDDGFVAKNPGASTGDFVVLSVIDKGVGMSDQVKAHLFEPFFTTKQLGQGTGLGLATCFGIVKQNGGYIAVESEVGRGTAFRVYMPAVRKPVEHLGRDVQPPADLRGSETILIAEDEGSVRKLTVRILRGQGYKVLETGDGEQALAAIKQDENREIRLLFTDTIMPKLGGKRLAEAVKAIRPDIKMLFTSGYTDSTMLPAEVIEGGVSFLNKPYSPQVLAEKVRSVLESK